MSKPSDHAQVSILKAANICNGKVEMIDPDKIGDHWWRATLYSVDTSYAVGDLIRVTLEATDTIVPEWKSYYTQEVQSGKLHARHNRHSDSFSLVGKSGHIASVSSKLFNLVDNQIVSSFLHARAIP